MRMEGRTTGKLGPFRYSESRSATVFKHHIRSLGSMSGKMDRAYAAPTGTVYVSESVMKGVLPQVLDEMLSTRAMLKKASKLYKALGAESPTFNSQTRIEVCCECHLW
jgi:hypothetical protein